MMSPRLLFALGVTALVVPSICLAGECDKVKILRNHSLGIGRPEVGDYTGTPLEINLHHCASDNGDNVIGNYSTPLLIMFGGGSIDINLYDDFSASMVRNGGYTVVVMRHLSPPPGGQGDMANFASPLDVQRVVNLFNKLQAEEEEFLFAADTSNIVLVAHSFGSVGLFFTLAGSCPFPFCGNPDISPSVTVETPAGIKAVALVGGSIVDPSRGTIQKFDNVISSLGGSVRTVPVCFVGAESERSVQFIFEPTGRPYIEESFEAMHPTRAQVVMNDLDHFSIMDDYLDEHDADVSPQDSPLPRDQQIRIVSDAVLRWFSYVSEKGIQTGYFVPGGFCDALGDVSAPIMQCAYEPETPTVADIIAALEELELNVVEATENGLLRTKLSNYLLKKLRASVDMILSIESTTGAESAPRDDSNSPSDERRIMKRVCKKKLRRFSARLERKRGSIDLETAESWSDDVERICSFLLG